MSKTDTQWVPYYTHLFTTKGIKKNKEYTLDSTIYPILLHDKEYHGIHLMNLKAIYTYEKKQYIHFDTEQYKYLPIGGYTKVSGDDIEALFRNDAMLRIDKTTFINILHKMTIEDHPSEPKGIRLRWGTDDNFIDLKDEDVVMKSLLAIYAARVLMILGIWDYKHLIRWIQIAIPKNIKPDEYATYPIFSHIEVLANHLLACSMTALTTHSQYSIWVYNTCAQFIAILNQYRTKLLLVEKEELPAANFTLHANLQQVQQLMVATLCNLVQSDFKKNHIEAFFVRQSNCPSLAKQEEKLQKALQGFIQQEKLRYNPLIKYNVLEAVDNLDDFCTHCKIFNIDLTPNVALKYSLKNNPDFLHGVNQAILENATIGNPKKYVHHTHQSLLKKTDIEREILNDLKAPFLDATIRLGKRLNMPSFDDFDSIDFDMIHTHLESKDTKSAVKKLKKDTGCHKIYQIHDLICFAQFAHTSIQEGRFRTPASLASGLQILNEDIASQVDDLPPVCRKYLSYISPMRLSYILFLLSLLSNL